jgi:hypothetical protein
MFLEERNPHAAAAVFFDVGDKVLTEFPLRDPVLDSPPLLRLGHF